MRWWQLTQSRMGLDSHKDLCSLWKNNSKFSHLLQLLGFDKSLSNDNWSGPSSPGHVRWEMRWVELKPLLLTSSNFYSCGEWIVYPWLQSDTEQTWTVYIESHSASCSNPWAITGLPFPAGLGWVVPAKMLKIFPSSAQPIGTFGVFLHQTYVFFLPEMRRWWTWHFGCHGNTAWCLC